MTPNDLRQQAEAQLRIAAASKQIDAAKLLFESFCLVGNTVAAEEQREKYHAYVDQFLDASAEVWHIGRRDLFKGGV